MSKVEDAAPGDAPALCALQLNAFDSPDFVEMFPEPYTLASWAGFVQRSVSVQPGLQTRVVLLRSEQGQAEAACLLHIARDKDAAAELYRPWEESWGAALPGMSVDKLDAFFGGMKTQHEAIMGAVPHIHLEVLMTHATARRRGHGMTLLLFANAVADEMRLPLYLDADDDAVGLYKRAGYVQQADEVRTSKIFVPMVRAPATS
ncbi:Acyl-N-acyltransferase [Cordyceps militaris]|uniref:Acyl-N-acyltransferase n=1 Tax=Cordyceps militaris TaxID=73501 RepID=A0A2H4SE71_CORMI|nr:Acyl-N-acyltransferase [Cordyceps militaris]